MWDLMSLAVIENLKSARTRVHPQILAQYHYTPYLMLASVQAVVPRSKMSQG